MAPAPCIPSCLALPLHPNPQARQRGVLVRRVEPTAPASAVLSKGDVILSFDGTDVGSDGARPRQFASRAVRAPGLIPAQVASFPRRRPKQPSRGTVRHQTAARCMALRAGTVPFRSGERISFSYLVSQKYMGDEVRGYGMVRGTVCLCEHSGALCPFFPGDPCVPRVVWGTLACPGLLRVLRASAVLCALCLRGSICTPTIDGALAPTRTLPPLTLSLLPPLLSSSSRRL